jgi:hypothetical protein
MYVSSFDGIRVGELGMNVCNVPSDVKPAHMGSLLHASDISFIPPVTVLYPLDGGGGPRALNWAYPVVGGGVGGVGGIGGVGGDGGFLKYRYTTTATAAAAIIIKIVESPFNKVEIFAI